MRILIIRHAEPDYVHDALTEKGRREASLLGERLSQIPASAYYVSPLGRAQETASYTLRLVGKQAITLPWLAEFRGYIIDENSGEHRIPWDLQSETWYTHRQLLDREHWQEDPLMASGNVAQIWRETQEGVDALLHDHGYDRQGGIYHCDANKDDTIMLFCHNAVGMAILAHLTHIPPVPLWQGFLCLPSAVTTLVTQERKKGEVFFRCVGLGDIQHLTKAGELSSMAGMFPECYHGVDSTDPATWPFLPEIPLIR